MLSGFHADGALPDADLPPSAIGASGVAAVRASTNGFVTGSGDNPASTYWPARLVQPLQWERSLGGGAALGGGFGGRASDAAGVIDIADADGFYATLKRSMAIDGRSVIVERLRRGHTYAQATMAWNGTAAGWASPDMLLRVRLRDAMWRLAHPISRGRYGGTGGADGTANLAGVWKPQSFGRCKNVKGVLVDPATELWQFNDGEVEAFDAVYVNGEPMGGGAWTPSVSTGCINLASASQGEITADLRGSKTGGNYVDTTAYIAHRIITEHSELAAASLDLQTIDQVEGQNSAEVGIHVPASAEDILAIDVLEELLAGVGGFIDCNELGKLQLGIFGGDWYGDTFEIDQRHIVSELERLALPLGLDPPWAGCRIGYERNWTVMTSGVAGAVTASRRQFLAEAYRYGEALGDQSGAYQLATSPSLPGLYASLADAEAEAARRVALYGVARGLYRARLPLTHGFRMGMRGRLTWGNWGLQSGVDCWVTRIRFDAQAGLVTVDLFA